jgi:hypothetical protein
LKARSFKKSWGKNLGDFFQNLQELVEASYAALPLPNSLSDYAFPKNVNWKLTAFTTNSQAPPTVMLQKCTEAIGLQTSAIQVGRTPYTNNRIAAALHRADHSQQHYTELIAELGHDS